MPAVYPNNYGGRDDAAAGREASMAITHLTPHELAVLKDVLLLRLVLDQGGSYSIRHDEVQRMAEELNGWGVFLRGDAERIVLTVTVPEGTRCSE